MACKKSLKENCQSVFPEMHLFLMPDQDLDNTTWRMSRMNTRWKIKAVDINSEQIEDCNRFFTKTGLSDRVTFETGDLTALTESEQL